MAVRRTLRYEIFRRDAFTCRYCHATDVALEIDHVVPVALGGDDKPGNLVTACVDCNRGKSSIAPDAPIVEAVSDDDLRWGRMVQRAAEIQAAQRHEFQSYVEAFDAEWQRWTFPDGSEMMRPSDYETSLRQFFSAGLDIETLADMVDVTAKAQRVTNGKLWRYFCGCCWRVIRERQEIARALLEGES